MVCSDFSRGIICLTGSFIMSHHKILKPENGEAMWKMQVLPSIGQNCDILSFCEAEMKPVGLEGSMFHRVHRSLLFVTNYLKLFIFMGLLSIVLIYHIHVF